MKTLKTTLIALLSLVVLTSCGDLTGVGDLGNGMTYSSTYAQEAGHWTPDGVTTNLLWRTVLDDGRTMYFKTNQAQSEFDGNLGRSTRNPKMVQVKFTVEPLWYDINGIQFQENVLVYMGSAPVGP